MGRKQNQNRKWKFGKIGKRKQKNELLKPKYEELRKKLTAAGYKRETSGFTRGDIYYIITNTPDPEDPTNPNKGTLKAVRTMCRELNGISIFDSNQCRLGETMEDRKEKEYNYNYIN